jgi:3D (Asp-Asp-Asp) domain-containing protein
VLNGKVTTVHTNQWVVGKLLDEQGIEVEDHDRLSVAMDSRLANGEQIVVNQASPIVVTADGETKTLYTIGKDVSGALEDLNIQLGEEDKLSLPPDSLITANMHLQIVRVKKELEEENEPIAFDTLTKNDPNLLKGKEEIVQEGQEGVLVKKIEKVYEDGDLVAENLVDQSVQSESVDKIVAIGTKVPVVVLSSSSPNIDEVTMSGITFGTKQILKNVTLTAYSSGASSTGKSASDPHFGITKSGTRVTEGRTIAVDPKVIPLGWWVYIDGLGFRRAEDIGSAIKGNKIDVYFDSESYVQRFGVKRGYTVYVIGPTKPETD